MQELEQIITLINGLGAEAKDAFIWYLAVKYGASLISGAMIFTIALMVIVGGKKLILAQIQKDSTLMAVRDELNKDIEYPYNLETFSGSAKYVRALKNLREKACSD